MKKHIIILFVVLLIALAACSSVQNEPSETINDNTAPSEIKETSTSKTTNGKPIETYTLPTSIKLNEGGSPLSGMIDGLEYEPAYRFCYYFISNRYIHLVSDQNAANAFIEELLSKQSLTEDLETMMLKDFVKHFNISKSDFLVATQKEIDAANSLGIDISKEEYEIPNADIIYTFDDEIINNYYRRE